MTRYLLLALPPRANVLSIYAIDAATREGAAEVADHLSDIPVGSECIVMPATELLEMVRRQASGGAYVTVEEV